MIDPKSIAPAQHALAFTRPSGLSDPTALSAALAAYHGVDAMTRDLVPVTPPVRPFDFNGQALRHAMLEGAPWFVAVDICRCLGLSLSKGAERHVAKLDDDERRKLTKREYGTGLPSDRRPIFSGTETAFTIVSESGLCKIVMRSDRVLARAFQNWVTREVLPSIRRTGQYVTPSRQEVLPPIAEAFQLLKTS